MRRSNFLFPSHDSLNLSKEELEWYRNFYHEEKKIARTTRHHWWNPSAPSSGANTASDKTWNSKTLSPGHPPVYKTRLTLRNARASIYAPVQADARGHHGAVADAWLLRSVQDSLAHNQKKQSIIFRGPNSLQTPRQVLNHLKIANGDRYCVIKEIP